MWLSIISTVAAVISLSWAIYEHFNNVKLQKKIAQSTRRYDAYSNFMRKIQELNTQMSKNPMERALKDVKEFAAHALKQDKPIEDCVTDFMSHLFDMVVDAFKPLNIMSQEIDVITLVASEELLPKLYDLQRLTKDLTNEIQNILGAINKTDPSSFKVLETMGYDKRWQRVQLLMSEITNQMRVECNI